MLLLVRALTPVKAHRDVALILGGLVVAHGITGTFVAVFRCAVPEVWNLVDNRCLNWVCCHFSIVTHA